MKVAILSLAMSATAFGATIVPFEREIPRVEQYTYITSQLSPSKDYSYMWGGDANDVEYNTGFSIVNKGPNAIVPQQPWAIEMIQRSFSFYTDDGSQRENYIWITDYNGSGITSDYFETIVTFLPRVGQMNIEEKEDTLLVTLSTGEEVVFDRKFKAITGGVLSEEAVDLNPNRAQRKFARIKYSGKGIMIKTEVRANDPRLGKDLQVIKPGIDKPCIVAKSAFWTQEGFPKFKFVRDEDAFAMIKEKCGAQYLP